MKKRGFTLIELLAVILILGVIALIAVPVVTNVIEESKKGAAKVSALNYISAVENHIAVASLLGNNSVVDSETPYDVNTLKSLGVKTKGDEPTLSSTVTINNGVVKRAELTFNGYTVNYDGATENIIITKAGVEVVLASDITFTPQNADWQGVNSVSDALDYLYTALNGE